MPTWLQVVARGNPLTYVVDGIRMLMLTGATIDLASLGVDILVLVAITSVLVTICAALYPRIVQ
jgi:ABC-2 type transport system permease protein